MILNILYDRITGKTECKFRAQGVTCQSSSFEVYLPMLCSSWLHDASLFSRGTLAIVLVGKKHRNIMKHVSCTQMKNCRRIAAPRTFLLMFLLMLLYQNVRHDLAFLLRSGSFACVAVPANPAQICVWNGNLVWGVFRWAHGCCCFGFMMIIDLYT